MSQQHGGREQTLAATLPGRAHDGWRPVCRRRVAGVLIAGALLAASSPALAQDTREGTIVAAQAEKAKHLAPYTPSRIEAVVSSALGILTPKPNGWYPVLRQRLQPAADSRSAPGTGMRRRSRGR